MDCRGEHGEPVAIIGVACRFPGARDPAEFHDLAVTGRRMFQPVRALPGRPLRAATLDDWAVPQVTQGDWPSGGLAEAQTDLGLGDVGAVRKLATEMTALALTDAGLREAAGHSRLHPRRRGGTPGGTVRPGPAGLRLRDGRDGQGHGRR